MKPPLPIREHSLSLAVEVPPDGEVPDGLVSCHSVNKVRNDAVKTAAGDINSAQTVSS